MIKDPSAFADSGLVKGIEKQVATISGFSKPASSMSPGSTPRMFSPICGCMKNHRETWDTSAPIQVPGMCMSAMTSCPPGRSTRKALVSNVK